MKRGESGLSLLVAVNKPLGMSSHDVVNRCRRIFAERRVGHTGTLDPLATGVLPICVGPATRLDKYLTGHDKRYRVSIAFGCETTTDDSEGQVTRSAEVPMHLYDPSYAQSFVKSLVGKHQQVPPTYSAVKVNGVKAYEAARKGKEVDLQFREIEIYDAAFLGTSAPSDPTALCWDIEVAVSKGTYIRSLARDVGRILDCPAHVHSLERVQSGTISIEQAVSLETLETLGTQAAIDPVAALQLSYAFGDEVERFVASGTKLYPNQVSLYEPIDIAGANRCGCMGSVCKSENGPIDNQLICIIVQNRLKALYRFDAQKNVWNADCVFSVPIARR